VNSVFLNQYSVVLDACVLGPMPVADLLLRLGEAEFYVPRWSNSILAELRKFLVSRGKSERQVDHRIDAMSRAFEDACITGYENLISSLTLPDPDDRHVLAAAIRGQAHSILTENIKHFPAKTLDVFGITAQRLDGFLVDQYDLNPNLFISVLKAQAQERNVDAERLLEKLNTPVLRSMIKLGT
jgi:predicted nucleic acid-binding protein